MLVGQIGAGDLDRPVFAKRFAQRQIKRGVSGQMVRAIPVEKAGAVDHIPGEPGPPRQRGAEAGAERDRKSTRLNSSHQIISYAVFSLKKKKKSSDQPLTLC